MEWPLPVSMPDAEADELRAAYAQARVILEYGSGGSTAFAASLQGKLVFSIESDRDWAVALQQRLDTAGLPSPVIVRHVDIGETGAWGRPLDDSHWQEFRDYPYGIWAESFFRHPDVVLVDGRFRVACFAATALNIERPVVLLFDDYLERPAYHVVQKVVEPVRMVGRMAVFELTPEHGRLVSRIPDLMFPQPTYAGRPAPYGADKGPKPDE